MRLRKTDMSSKSLSAETEKDRHEKKERFCLLRPRKTESFFLEEFFLLFFLASLSVC